ncbi:MAG: YdeI family protein [Gammaproteobacteria bacterium]
MTKTESVEDYIKQSDKWESELAELIAVLQSTTLEESIKWGTPCYSHHGKNVISVASYTDYFGLWFHQGALLSDTSKKLINAQEGRTKALRQWRMTKAADIKPTIIKRYIKESIANVDKGKEIKPSKAKEISIPPQLNDALSSDAKVADAFECLTPRKRREYAEFVTQARLPATKLRRVKKIVPMILKNVGLHDRYRKK